MRLIKSACLIAIAIFFISPEQASAQFGMNLNPAGRIANPAGRVLGRFRPSVTPYLGLLNNNNQPDFPNYQTLVRPQIEQQRQNRQTSDALRNLNQQVSTLSAGTPSISTPMGVRPTGLPKGSATLSTYFMNKQHYYPVIAGGR